MHKHVDMDVINGFIEDRLNAMLSRPAMWGTMFAVEMQVLLLLEMTVLHRLSIEEFRKSYCDFINEKAPDPRPVPLAFRVDDDINRLASILTEFRSILSAG